MSDTYTKLFSSITESTVWGEPYPTRIVWVAMLAMADARGNVYGAVPGLARRANVTLPEAEAALAAFLAPDPYSRTKDDDGRRIEPIDGGWRLINHGKYSAVRNAEERREYKRQWDRENRPSGHGREQSDSSPTQSDTVRQIPTNPTEPTPPALTPTPVTPERVTTHPPQAADGDGWGSFEGHAVSRETPSPAAAHSIALRAEGFACTPMNPHLVAFVQDGGTVEHLQAVMALPDCAGKGAGYVIKIARRELAEKAAPVVANARAGPSYAPADSKTLSGMKAIQGMKRGLVQERNNRRFDGAHVVELGADACRRLGRDHGADVD